ncbi:hypothetical protein JCM10295v2_002817 [Rhodotorula toruloides]
MSYDDSADGSLSPQQDSGARQEPAALAGADARASTSGGPAAGKKGAKRGAGSDKVALDKDGNPKKKRKQLVACDSCRLRRVKCDKADMGGGPCSECVKKSITCTDTYVKNKPKVVRGGKLIAQAKKLYGENGVGGPVASSSASPAKLEYESSEDGRRQSFSSVLPFSDHRLSFSFVNQELGEHLVRTFFDILQPQCPLVDQDMFMQAWEASGRVPENMSPANECLALVIQAWAARITDNPAVIGSGGPTLDILKRGEGQDFTEVGNRRQDFARAALQRALNTVDQRGALRLASATSCSALTLLEFLVTWDDSNLKTTMGRYLMSSACEHLRNLQLGTCDDPNEQAIPPERASNGTLLWMIYTRDALGSMMGGRFCSLTDDDLASLCDLFTNPVTADVMSYVSSNDARMLSGLAVASIFRYCVSVVRNTVTRMTGPLARRQRLTEQVVHDIWTEIDEGSRFGAVFRQSVERATFGADAPKTDVWFRDLIAMKSQHTLGVHFAILDRLREEEQKAPEYQDPEYVHALRRLRQQSDERLFYVAREYTRVLRGYGAGVIFSAAITVEYSSILLNSLVETPSVEQGGSVADWTWVQKIEEVSQCIDLVKLSGWMWSGYDGVIARARHMLGQQSMQLQQHAAPPAPLPPISTSYIPSAQAPARDWAHHAIPLPPPPASTASGPSSGSPATYGFDQNRLGPPRHPSFSYGSGSPSTPMTPLTHPSPTLPRQFGNGASPQQPSQHLAPLYNHHLSPVDGRNAALPPLSSYRIVHQPPPAQAGGAPPLPQPPRP